MHVIRRVVHGIRKVAAGLRPFNESVWPGLRNDLFVAHESIYELFTRHVEGSSVLDAGCGTGYGSAILAAKASQVLGVDVDPASVRYADRHFAAENVRFRIADIQELGFNGDFDVVVSSNAIEHLDEPRRFVDGTARALRPGGRLIVAVPPIFTDHDRHAHGDIHYHRANLDVGQWRDLLSHRFDVEYFIHRAREGVTPDFHSQRISRLTTSDFLFEPVGAEAIYSQPTITAIFLCSLR